MDACTSLKVIGQHGVGLDNIDVQEATRHKIKVLNVPDGNYISVAEHTMAFILALSRSLRINDCSVRKDAWYSRENRYTMEVCQKNLLIVGLGRIGRAVAKRAKAFGMQVMAYDGFVTKEDMEKIIKLLEPSYIAGLTLLGGEPMEYVNQQGLLPLLRRVKEQYPDKTIWCYTGYLYDRDILDNFCGKWEETRELLSYLDVIVDGEFVEAQKDISLRFRGSSNQRIIDVKKSQEMGRTVMWEDEGESV